MSRIFGIRPDPGGGEARFLAPKFNLAGSTRTGNTVL